MKIKMLVGIAGADFALSPGDETERFPDAECERFIAAGFAEEVKAEPIVEPAPAETAAVAPIETATTRRKRG